MFNTMIHKGCITRYCNIPWVMLTWSDEQIIMTYMYADSGALWKDSGNQKAMYTYQTQYLQCWCPMKQT